MGSVSCVRLRKPCGLMVRVAGRLEVARTFEAAPALTQQAELGEVLWDAAADVCGGSTGREAWVQRRRPGHASFPVGPDVAAIAPAPGAAAWRGATVSSSTLGRGRGRTLAWRVGHHIAT